MLKITLQKNLRSSPRRFSVQSAVFYGRVSTARTIGQSMRENVSDAAVEKFYLEVISNCPIYSTCLGSC